MKPLLQILFHKFLQSTRELDSENPMPKFHQMESKKELVIKLNSYESTNKCGLRFQNMKERKELRCKLLHYACEVENHGKALLNAPQH